MWVKRKKKKVFLLLLAGFHFWRNKSHWNFQWETFCRFFLSATKRFLLFRFKIRKNGWAKERDYCRFVTLKQLSWKTSAAFPLEESEENDWKKLQILSSLSFLDEKKKRKVSRTKPRVLNSRKSFNDFIRQKVICDMTKNLCKQTTRN